MPISVISVLFIAVNSAMADEKVDVFIRAFIPKVHSSTRVIVPKQPHTDNPVHNNAGDTMVDPPASSIVGCFPTDQRSFSGDITASSRLQSNATVTLKSGAFYLEQNHPVFESNAIDCGSAEIINKATTSNQDQHFTFVKTGEKAIDLTISASGKNPNFVQAPTIDINGTFKIDLSARTIGFIGKVDQYPAYEAYARLNGGGWIAIFNISPEYGKTALDLIFTKDVNTGQKSLLGTASLPPGTPPTLKVQYQ